VPGARAARVLLSLAACACAPGPAPSSSASRAPAAENSTPKPPLAPPPVPASASAAPAAPASTVPAAPAAASASAPAASSPSSAAAAPSPPLISEAGAPLPQTEARPSADSPHLRKNLELVVEAIAHDDPARAIPAFFPLVAYTQVKAIERPERDWKRRLIGAFERDVHEYHRALGRDAASAVLLRVEVPEAKVKWMKPGTEGNRVGYFRVLRSKLVLGLSGGRERALEVTSLISWRGEWYVVHLSGFD
jgi:hypothetical protein